MLEAHHFIIFTDHKPITYAFQQMRDKCSPRQFNHLDFVAQFTTDIRHISGQNNVVADALSRVESVTAPPSYDALAALQNSDDKLRTLRNLGVKCGWQLGLTTLPPSISRLSK
jgi:cleavage and polyadenylation specificity factor subunit 1